MRIFVSSIITGYEDRREAVFDAVEALGHDLIRAEDFSASTNSPRVACLSGVRDADLVILVLGARYGTVQQSGQSATHEEFEEAKRSKSIYAFVESNVEQEPAQAAFIDEVRDWQGGLLTQDFSDASDLRRKVTKAIHNYELKQAAGSSDANEIETRTLKLLPDAPDERRHHERRILTAIAGGPLQALLRPAELEKSELDRSLAQAVFLGENAVLDRRLGMDSKVLPNRLVVFHKDGSLTLYSDGSILLDVPLPENSEMMAIIEEDVRGVIETGIRLAVQILDMIDQTERLRDFGIACRIESGGFAGWRTRARDARSTNTMQINNLGREELSPVMLSPPTFNRSKLRAEISNIAEDLTILLRHQFDS